MICKINKFFLTLFVIKKIAQIKTLYKHKKMLKPQGAGLDYAQMMKTSSKIVIKNCFRSPGRRALWQMPEPRLKRIFYLQFLNKSG